MEPAPQSEPALFVPGWTDKLSSLQARFPRFWIGLGNLESRMLAERLGDISIDRPIYIAGLARSGTTILLELLARHPDVSSHRYRDFPPVLAPWFWNRFIDRAASRERPASERAHGDRIEVTPESPEAFEEVVWMAFFERLHDPETSAVLDGQTTNEEFERFYRDHIRKMVLIRGGERYLSKANYNVTRLRYLQKLFADARFIVPYRDPVWHIASLMRQHERFSREHARDARLQRHMSRAGHFEFGLDRRPVNSGDAEISRRVRGLWSEGRDVQGWALYWKDIHGHIASVLEADAVLRNATKLVGYERLCRDPGEVLTTLLAHCELSGAGPDIAAAAARTIEHPSYYQPPFDAAQMALIEELTGPVKQRLDRLAA